MNGEHKELYLRIEEYNLDDPTAPYPFTARLAAENGWSVSYARRVAEEYKKFAFLAVTAGHPVTPPDAVDRAWHLHLTYTHAYWDRFCAEVLKAPLHHTPTTGGAAEKEKFTEQYARTLESYQAAFGHAPPADIWPGTAARFAGTPVYRRVDTQRHWIILIPKLPVLVAGCLLLYVAAHVAGRAIDRYFGLGQPAQEPAKAAPLTPAEREVLLTFAAGAAATWVVAVALRWWCRGPSGGAPPVAELDPYETAYLAGGKDAVLPAAVAALVDQNFLKVDATGTRLARDPAAGDAVPPHPVEHAVWNAVIPGAAVTLEELNRGCSLPAAPSERLVSLGLTVPRGFAAAGLALPLAVALLAPLLAALWMLVGPARGNSSSLQIALCVLATLAAAVAFGPPLHRTRRGDRVLAEFQAKHANLRTAVRAGADSHSGSELARAVALFGIAVLAAGPWAPVYAFLQPYAGGARAADGHSGCGGGCGGCD